MEKCKQKSHQAHCGVCMRFPTPADGTCEQDMVFNCRSVPYTTFIGESYTETHSITQSNREFTVQNFRKPEEKSSEAQCGGRSAPGHAPCSPIGHAEIYFYRLTQKLKRCNLGTFLFLTPSAAEFSGNIGVWHTHTHKHYSNLVLDCVPMCYSRMKKKSQWVRRLLACWFSEQKLCTVWKTRNHLMNQNFIHDMFKHLNLPVWGHFI